MEERYILYSLIQRWLYIPKTNSILFTFSMLCFTHPLLPISLDLLGGSYDLVIVMLSITKAQRVCTLEGNQNIFNSVRGLLNIIWRLCWSLFYGIYCKGSYATATSLTFKVTYSVRWPYIWYFRDPLFRFQWLLEVHGIKCYLIPCQHFFFMIPGIFLA